VRRTGAAPRGPWGRLPGVAPPASLPPRTAWQAGIERALAEDLGSGDLTTRAVLPEDRALEARIEARQTLVVCGLEPARAVFDLLGGVRAELRAADGERAEAGSVLVRLTGSAHAILAGERTALNLLGHLSAIATHTRRFVDAVAGTGVAIVDTRKTLPGWRALAKYAVAVGGGTNHRSGLYDALLVKDNHVAAAGGVGLAVKAARAAAPPHVWLQAEVESEEQAEEALAAGADSLLLDNRSVAELRELARRFRDRTILEASGGVRLENVRAIAETGVHRISIGALTHSAPQVDVALEVAWPGARA
jgi:nicotinate-nucleotide pyrophosphorylase (carboxylating)